MTASARPYNGVSTTPFQFNYLSKASVNGGAFASVMNAGPTNTHFFQRLISWPQSGNFIGITTAGDLRLVSLANMASHSSMGLRIGSGASGDLINWCAYGTGIVIVGRWTSTTPAVANYLCYYNGATWASLGTFDGVVGGCCTDGAGDLIVAGEFRTINGNTIRGLAKYSGGVWSEVGGGVQSGGSRASVGCGIRAGKIVVLGAFDQVGATTWTRNSTEISCAEYDPVGMTWAYEVRQCADRNYDVAFDFGLGAASAPIMRPVLSGLAFYWYRIGSWVANKSGPYLWNGIGNAVTNLQGDDSLFSTVGMDVSRVRGAAMICGVEQVDANVIWVGGFWMNAVGGVASDGLTGQDGDVWTTFHPYERATKFNPQFGTPSYSHFSMQVGERQFHSYTQATVHLPTGDYYLTAPLVEITPSDAGSYPIPTGWETCFADGEPRVWWPDKEFYYHGGSSWGNAVLPPFMNYDPVANVSYFFGSLATMGYCKDHPIGGSSTMFANVVKVDWTAQTVTRWAGDSAALPGETYPVSPVTNRIITSPLIRNSAGLWAVCHTRLGIDRLCTLTEGDTAWAGVTYPAANRFLRSIVWNFWDDATVMYSGNNAAANLAQLHTYSGGSFALYWSVQTTTGLTWFNDALGFWTEEDGKRYLWLPMREPSGVQDQYIVKLNVTDKTEAWRSEKFEYNTLNGCRLLSINGKLILLPRTLLAGITYYGAAYDTYRSLGAFWIHLDKSITPYDGDTDDGPGFVPQQTWGTEFYLPNHGRLTLGAVTL